MSFSSLSCISSQAAKSTKSNPTTTTAVLSSFTVAAATTTQYAISDAAYYTNVILAFSGTYDFVYVRFSDGSTFGVFYGNTGTATFPINTTGLTAWAYAGKGTNVPTSYVTSSDSFSAPIIVTGIGNRTVPTVYSDPNNLTLSSYGWYSKLKSINVYLTDSNKRVFNISYLPINLTSTNRIRVFLGTLSSFRVNDVNNFKSDGSLYDVFTSANTIFSMQISTTSTATASCTVTLVF